MQLHARASAVITHAALMHALRPHIQVVTTSRRLITPACSTQHALQAIMAAQRQRQRQQHAAASGAGGGGGGGGGVWQPPTGAPPPQHAAASSMVASTFWVPKTHDLECIIINYNAPLPCA